MKDETTERAAFALLEAALAEPDPAASIRTSEAPAAVQDRALALLSRDGDTDLRTGMAPRLDLPPPPPERVGAYRITGLIGQGGMGAVYRGERDAGDFEHRVAIKLVRAGGLAGDLVERFARERQTLARLAHPGIARLFDGGATADGQPYIVMELVDGVPLHRWIATDPPLAARTALFLAICDAVGFAHRNLIVHRDLTPANVLVTPDGQPKLIDFGIARPVEEAAAARPELAGPAQTLTPGFAAPERFLPGQPATTLSDIFSLGRLLDTLHPAPRAPDLDAIVAKATAVEPEARYASADALAVDVVRWRDRLPVAARRGGRGYVLRRFIARNRVPVLAAAAALALLIAAFSGAVWSLQRAVVAQRAEASRFEQVRSLARYLLFDLNAQLSRVAGNTGARADLAEEAERYLSVLSAASGGDRPDLTLETAQGLIQLARIQASPSEPNLGQVVQADRNLVRAQALLRGLDPADRRAAAAAATAHAVRGQILLNDEMRQNDAAREIATARRIAETIPGDIEARRAVRRAEIDLADIGSDPKALSRLADALEQDVARWPERARGSRAAALDRAYATYLRGQSASETGADDFGLSIFLTAEKQFDALLRADDRDPAALLLTSLFLRDAFAAASRAGAEQTAQRLVLRADALSERLIALDDRDEGIRKRAGSVKEGIAQNLRDHDRFDEAIAMQTKVLALRHANIGPDRNARRVADLGFSQMIMGIIARDAGRRDLACRNFTDAADTIGELERRNQLAGFIKDFLPGLRAKKRLCATGATLSALKTPLR